MLKLTRTKSGLRILTVKAFGFYANVSFGKSAKRKPTLADLYARATKEQINRARLAAWYEAERAEPTRRFDRFDGYKAAFEAAMFRQLSTLA